LSSKSLRSPRMRLTLLCKEQSLRCKGEAGGAGETWCHLFLYNGDAAPPGCLSATAEPSSHDKRHKA
jgi:hypothetical protein